jgi:predicted MFS family arabinose efflux permease
VGLTANDARSVQELYGYSPAKGQSALTLVGAAALNNVGIYWYSDGRIRACMAGLAATAGAIAVFALTPGPGWLGAGAVAFQQLIGDFGMVVVQIHSVSLVQKLAPRDQLARVNGAILFASSWAMLAGALLGGVLGEQLGNRGTLALAATILLLAAATLTAAREDRSAGPDARPR